MMGIESRAPSPVRVLGLVPGDIHAPNGEEWVKYRRLFEVLATQCDLVDVRDVHLRGLDRYQNAIRSFRWPRTRWRASFHKSTWSFERRSARTRRLVRDYDQRIDVVFQHSAIFSAARRHGDPAVVIYTDFTHRLAQREDRWRNPFTTVREHERWNALETAAYRNASFILTRSDYARRSIIGDYGIPAERTATVGAGMNFAALPPSPAPLEAPRILFIGREFERKGGDYLLAAFRLLRERMPQAELWMVTDRQDIDGVGVRRIAPTLDRGAISALYQSASIFAMPSWCETWGDVFLEAMAHGLPCLGTRNDAMPEIIVEGETGYVVTAGDSGAIAARLEALLRDADLRRRMGLRGRARVSDHFTWEHVIRRIVPYLEKAGSESRDRRVARAHFSPAFPVSAHARDGTWEGQGAEAER